LRRLYDPDVLERLSLITLGRAAGFTLDEILGMFLPVGAPQIDKAMLRAKADQIDGTIRRLVAMKNGLRHAAVCPAPSHLECPSFRKLMRAAVGELRLTGRVAPRRGRI
jgi:DNA-binding transcriptional MerR regulator